MIIKESKARSDIYIGSELYNHPLNLLPSPLLYYLITFNILKIRNIKTYIFRK
jgi:hypothetical protein